MSEMQTKYWGSLRPHFRDKVCGKLPLADFEKLAHVIQHGLQGFYSPKFEGKSIEANHPSQIL